MRSAPLRESVDQSVGVNLIDFFMDSLQVLDVGVDLLEKPAIGQPAVLQGAAGQPQV